ncbi:T9SS type A sorting domain-containing protein, partial [Candidatus Poribacteria bacterium]|nr:T9SS type A sorting domain-containing protein [Candidatus Poribacteria bacterium]
DGSQRVIAVHDGRDWGPAWAPDGLRLAFLSDREGGSHIYVVDVDVDLAPPVRLTWGMAEQREVAWSPDGSGLAFISHRYGLTDIYMYDSNGGSLRALTRQADPSGGPAWAPDGGRLAYVSRIDGNAEVYVVGVESLGTRNLSQHGMADGSPVWSPDSSRLAFVSSRDGNAEVFVIDADGTGARNVTQNEFADGAPSWSPDGRLAFATNRDGNWQIYVHTPAPDAAWDVNDDGRVDILDLVTVAQTFGASGADLAGDVTGDGTVNILDLVLVAAHFGEATVVGAAPARTPRPSDASMIEDWLDAARGADDGSAGHRRGIETLRRLLAGLTPDTTALLRNYPNPFNPETWIPFRLSSEAQVAITVYDVTGKVVREIDVGALAPGDYLTQGRAAHWDGRNLIGEPVGSGVYYIELRAGTYRAVDRLIMAK